MTQPPTGPLLSTRAALVFLLAVLSGLAAASLTVLSGGSLPTAVLAGGAATGGGLALFHSLIGQ